MVQILSIPVNLMLVILVIELASYFDLLEMFTALQPLKFFLELLIPNSFLCGRCFTKAYDWNCSWNRWRTYNSSSCWRVTIFCLQRSAQRLQTRSIRGCCRFDLPFITEKLVCWLMLYVTGLKLLFKFFALWWH